MTTPAKHRLTGLFLVLGLSTIAACGSEEKKDEKKDEAAKKEDGKKDDAAKTDGKTDDAKKDGGEVAATGGDTATPPTGGDTATPPPAGAGEPGPAYFAIDEKGIVRLAADGTFTLIPNSPQFHRDVLVGPDNQGYVLTYNELFKIEGDNFTKVLEFSYDNIGSINQLAWAKDNTYWAIGTNGVGFYDGKTWTVTKDADLGPDVKVLMGMAVAADGTPWVASSNDLHYRGADGKWAKADTSALDRMPYFNSLLTTPSGQVFAQASDYLGKISAADKIEKIEIKTSKSFLSFYKAGVSSKGNIVLASTSCDVARVDPANPGTVWFHSGEEGYGCESLTSVGLDGQDRVWVASRAGLNVMGPGDENKSYASGSVLELVGNVKSVAIVGAGPTLPEPGAVKKGGVAGKLLLDGTAVANAKVELCPQPSFFVKTTPCADSKVKFSGTSDASGNFTFNDVPLGNYNVAVEVNGKWQTTWSTDFGVHMKEGSVYDIGSLKLTAQN